MLITTAGTTDDHEMYGTSSTLVETNPDLRFGNVWDVSAGLRSPYICVILMHFLCACVNWRVSFVCMLKPIVCSRVPWYCDERNTKLIFVTVNNSLCSSCRVCAFSFFSFLLDLMTFMTSISVSSFSLNTVHDASRTPNPYVCSVLCVSAAWKVIILCDYSLWLHVIYHFWSQLSERLCVQ